MWARALDAANTGVFHPGIYNQESMQSEVPGSQSGGEVCAQTIANSAKEADSKAPAMLFCPRCDAELTSHRCKLVCVRCGYYMSCADYY